MRNRIFAVLAIAILAGGGLAYGTYNLVNSQPQTQAAAKTQPVVVAGSDLALGAALKADDLRVVQFPDGQAPEGAFTTTEELLGRGVISPMVKNEPVLPAKLASKEAGAGLPPIIPEGMRAVSVRVDDVIGVAGYVLPNSRVDVMATASPTEQNSDITTKVILSNVQVVTAGTRIDQDQDNKPVQVTVVTLVVAPEQAERLALASTEGKIQLALRNPLDQGSPDTPGVKKAALVGTVARLTAAPRVASPKRTARAAEPVTMLPPAPAPMPTVEMIRGDKRAQEVIK
jgi:pilus assembly protein CpaB